MKRTGNVARPGREVTREFSSEHRAEQKAESQPPGGTRKRLPIDIAGWPKNFEGMATVVKTKKTLEKFQNAHIEVKEAVAIAMGYFRDLFPELAKANMMLEEIEQSGDGKQWLITLGYDTAGTFRDILQSARARAYKRFTINRTDGHVVSVKIHPVS